MQHDYDSRPDTYAHIQHAQHYLTQLAINLLDRAHAHDHSKLHPPEVDAFNHAERRLRGVTFGSPEYQAGMIALGDALRHHYAHNRHHPEHHPDGIQGMNLLDLIEMLCDWIAATHRHADGDIRRSLTINTERFQIDPAIARLLSNTIDALERVPEDPCSPSS